MSITSWPRVPYVGIGCIPVHDNRVLLVRNRAGLWSTPGGHLAFGESPVDAAIRETKEETGVTVRNVEFVTITNDIIEPDRHYVTIWFRGEVEDPTLKIGDLAEITEAAWCDANDLPSPRHVYFETLLAGRTLTQTGLRFPFPAR